MIDLWLETLMQAGLSERESTVLMILNSNSNQRASEVAKELGTTRLEAYNNLSRLQELGLVSVTADRPMKYSAKRLDSAIAHLIDLKKKEIESLSDALGKLKNKDSSKDKSIESDIESVSKFNVLKNRVNIFKRLNEMAEDSEEKMVLMIGQYGILHLCRSESLEQINLAATKGVVIQVIANLESRTLRHYENLHESIEVRHHEDIMSSVFIQDNKSMIQYLNTENNPFGKGKDELALAIESNNLTSAHMKIIDSVWKESIPFDIASKRYSENKIIDPLRLTVGEGSFLQKFRSAVGFYDDLPDEDEPFNPDHLISVGDDVSGARQSLSSGNLSNLISLGINLNELLRQIGNRIGQELSFSLRSISNDVEYLEELITWWEYVGLGFLEYGLDPNFHVSVVLSNPPTGDDNELPMWEMDDGIIEGALERRFGTDSGVIIRKEEPQDSEHSRYSLIHLESNQ